MEPTRTVRDRPLLARFLGTFLLVGTMMLAADAAYANPGMAAPPPEPQDQASCQSNSCSSPSEDAEDHHKTPDPDWDDLKGLDTLDLMHRKRRPNLPAGATGAGTAGDEAAANDAVAAAAAARAAKAKSNIDMSDAMRAERCANNRARIAELERLLGQLNDYAGSLKDAEARSNMLYNDLPASSAEYVLARDDVKQLKAAMARVGNQGDLQSQLAGHRNNLVALGCD